jgi:hypothetical protein
MTYRACRGCQFRVEPHQHRCPGCGIAAPQTSTSAIRWRSWIAAPLVGGFVGTFLLGIGVQLVPSLHPAATDISRNFYGLLGLLLYGTLGTTLAVIPARCLWKDWGARLKLLAAGGVIGGLIGAGIGLQHWQELTPDAAVATGGVVVGGPLGVLAGLIYGRLWAARLDRPAPPSLQHTYETAAAHLEAAQAREAELTRTRESLAAEADTPRWQALRDECDFALRVVQSHTKELTTVLWSTTTLGLANGLLPFADRDQDGTWGSFDQQLQAIDTTRREVEQLLLEWTADPASDTPPGQTCLQQLQQLLTICEALRQEVLARQLREVSTAPLASPVSAPPSALEQLTATTELLSQVAAFDWDRILREAAADLVAPVNEPSRAVTRTRQPA